MHVLGMRIAAAALTVCMTAACPMAQRMQNYDPDRCRRNCIWMDENADGICDNRETGFVDADGDGICDNRTENCGQGNGCGNGQGNGCGNGQGNGYGRGNGNGNGQGNQHGKNG